MQFIDLAAQQRQRLQDGQTIREAVDSRIAAVLNYGRRIRPRRSWRPPRVTLAWLPNRRGQWYRCLANCTDGAGVAGR